MGALVVDGRRPGCVDVEGAPRPTAVTTVAFGCLICLKLMVGVLVVLDEFEMPVLMLLGVRRGLSGEGLASSWSSRCRADVFVSLGAFGASSDAVILAA